MILACHSAAVFAGPNVNVDIAAQSLSSALRDLASQAGVQLVFTAETVGTAKARAIKGEMSVDAALRKLLIGSGLDFRQDGERNYVVLPPAQVEHGLAEVVVTATRTERRIDDVPASVSVISAKDISLQNLLKVEDALRNVEGIDFSEGSGGGNGGPSIRGVGGSFAGATSVVLVDGMPTDSSISGVVGRGGFNFLAAQDVERMEVVRGPASALYGPNVIGGVVNVIPKRWVGPSGSEVEASLGSHDSRSLAAAVGMANEVVDVRLSIFDFRTDGYVAQRELDPDGNKDLKSRAWTDRKWNLNGGIRPSDDQEITFGFQQFRTDTDMFGGRPNFRVNHEGDAYTLGYRKEFANQNSVKLTYRHAELLQFMPWDDQSWNGNMGSYILAATWYRKSKTDTVEAQSELHLAANNTLVVGASYQTALYEVAWDDKLYGGNSRTNSAATSTGLFMQDEHRFDDLTLTVGGRYDWIAMHGDKQNGTPTFADSTSGVFNPRLGLRYHFSPASSVYLSAGTAYVPALNWMKSSGGNPMWLDSPNLKPESSTTYEIGANHKLAWANLRAALYHTDYTDKISSVPVGAAWQYVNIGKTTVDGIELGVDGNLPGGWKPYANYAYTDSIIRKNPSDTTIEGKHTQRIAPHKFNLGVVYAPSSQWEARIGGRYVSSIYFTDANTSNHRAPDYFVADAKFSVKLPIPGSEVFVAVNNLFDKKYVVWEYENADRRNFWAGVSAKF
jgi:outer membrane receptor protein involved in Fe transport